MIVGIVKTSVSRLAVTAAAAALVAPVAGPAAAASGADDAVALRVSSGVLPVNEQAQVAVARGLVLTGGAVRRAEVTIASGASPEDRLVFRDRERITGSFDDGQLVLTGRASARAYKRALRAVRFVHDGDAPQPARSVELTVVPVGGAPVTATKQLRVRAINDAPQITASAGTTTLQAGGSAGDLDGGLAVADVDSAVLTGATVSGVDGVTPFFTDRSGIVGTLDEGSGELTLTGSASVADYQAALRSITLRASGNAAVGARTVRVEVRDDGGLAATTSRALTVTSAQTPPEPVAVDDEAAVLEDADPRAIDVLANDTAPSGALEVASVTSAGHGIASLDDGTVTYAPSADYCGSDEFGYALATGQRATVRVSVTCVDDAPVAAADATSVDQDGSVVVEVLRNDTDVDGGPLRVESVTQPADGGVVVNGDGTLTYTPATGFCGRDSFTYTLNGGSTATVAVTVTCVSSTSRWDGRWVGSVDQRGFGSYTVDATFDSTDGFHATVDYPSLACGGYYDNPIIEGDTLRVTEHITYGTTNCVVTSEVRFTIVGDTLRYDWSYFGSSSTGVLSRLRPV